MAELTNYIMGLLTVLFVATAIVTVYSSGITNNINNGGNNTTIPFPLMNQTQGYTIQMNTYAAQLAVQI